MSVTADDVRRIARLARLAEPEDRVDALVGELIYLFLLRRHL